MQQTREKGKVEFDQGFKLVKEQNLDFKFCFFIKKDSP
jgi:hypothetical protein